MFIVLTVVSRITLKLTMLIIKEMRIEYLRNHNKDPDWYTENYQTIACEARFSSYLPTGLFTIAMFINSMRWLNLVRINI